MNAQKNFKAVALALVLSLLISISAQATPFTWSGASSNAWADANNWGGSGFPNAYTDQATIGVNVNNPVSLSTTALLGGGGTALTVGTGGSGTTADLDIAAAGTLGMQGSIFITTPTSGSNKNRGMTIEGTLRNDGAAGTFYTISGLTTTGHGSETLTLNGGTISSSNGGGWTFSSPVTVQGYGTISAPLSGTTTFTTNTNNQAITINNNTATASTLTNPTFAFTSSNNAYFNLGNTTLNGVTLSGTSGRSQFTNLLPGTFNNNWGNTAYGLLNVTGDSTINGAITLSGGYKVFDITNSTLTLNNPGTIPTAAGNTSSPPAFVLGTGGNLNITGNSNVIFPTSAPIPINGGTLAYTGTGTFSAYSFIGNGSISGVSNMNAGSVNANGGTLTFAANSNYGTTLGILSGAGASLNSSTGSTLDLKGTYNFIQPGNISPNGGAVNLDGATLALTNPWVVNLNAGTINVTNNSFMTGVAGSSFNSNATLGINSGKTLNVSGGPFTNSGTLAIGGGTLNNLGSGAYSLGGSGLITMAGGSVTSTGGGGFISTDILRGYGTVSAPFTNSGQVRADGAGIEQTLSFTSPVSETLNTGGMGWFAQNHGMLTLPAITISSAGTYNWGGDPTSLGMVNSIDMTFTGSVTSGSLSIALLSSDRIDVPAGLVNPIGVWSFNANSLIFGSVSMAFRYDDALATALSLNQNGLGLLGYNGSAWTVIATNIDTANKLLTTASGLGSLYQDFAIEEVPEPATVALLAFGWIALQMKRRGSTRMKS
jgi:hypothetical protein